MRSVEDLKHGKAGRQCNRMKRQCATSPGPQGLPEEAPEFSDPSPLARHPRLDDRLVEALREQKQPEVSAQMHLQRQYLETAFRR